MSQESEPKLEFLDEKELQEGISKKEKSKEIVTDLKNSEESNKTDQIREKLKIKVDAGLNLTDKSVYPPVFHEIAKEVGCDYSTVSKEAKRSLNKSKTIKDVVQSDKNKIIINRVDPTTRPERKEQIKKSQASPTITDEGQNLEIEFETATLEMSFENVANFEKMFLGVSPQAKKMKKMAMTIAIYNDRMSRSGHPEKRINVSDRLMQVMIWGGLIGMFLEPLGIKWRDRAESKSKDGIKKKESMR